MGQMLGEAGQSHPHLEDPLEMIFIAARAWDLSPVEVAEMDGEMFHLYLAWRGGIAVGEEIKRERED